MIKNRSAVGYGLNFKKVTALLVMLMYITSISSVSTLTVGAAESIEKKFKGYSQSYSVLNNLNYSDVKGKGLPTAKAIYYTGALGIIKGMGTKAFGRIAIMNKDEALATAYRAAGKEALAQQMANQLESKASASKASTLSKLWAKGYLKLAADDGIITKDQFNATLTNTTISGTKPFAGTAGVQRQELAYWLARTLNLQPEYEQQRLFNSYKDWKKVDPSKVTYIEAALQQRIINADSKGYLKPDALVTREQAAQMVYNSLEFIYPMMKLSKYTGVVENFFERTNVPLNSKIKTFNIRNENTKLHTIEVSKPITAINLPYNEQTTKLVAKGTADLVVYKNGVIGDSSLLKNGDTIEYTANQSGVIRFVQVVPKSSAGTGTNSSAANSSGDEDKNIHRGIVEENNPMLGYITIFKDNASTDTITGDTLKTYNYISATKVDVRKNNKKTNIEAIEAGDTAFIKLDEEGNVSEISAADNYIAKYGKIISLSKSNINVKIDEGEILPLSIDKGLVSVVDGKLASLSLLNDGDRVRILLQITPQATKLKEIRVENQPQFISNVYKAKFSKVDEMSDNIVLTDLQVLTNNKWQRADTKGIATMKLDNDCEIFNSNTKLDINNLNVNYSGNQIYIAAKKDFGGGEIATVINFINQYDAEKIYDDSINSKYNSTGTFTLLNNNINVTSEKGSIIIKNGRLVTGSSISNGDMAYVVAGRDSYGNGDFKAGIVVVNERYSTSAYQIYRGRIKQINENSDFTIESFSKLEGMNWSFYNTPKTFSINSQTGIAAVDGIIAQRDFVGYGSNSFLNTVVYVVANGTNAVQISTSPYANANTRGTVYSVSNGSASAAGGTSSVLGTSGSDVQMLLRNIKIYNQTSGVWIDDKDVTFKIPANCIILKNGTVANYQDINKGSTVRVLRKDDTSIEACIVIVED